MKLRIFSTTFAALLAATAFAQEKPAEPAKPAAPAEPASIVVFAPTNLEGLKAVKGQKILVEGVIVATGENKTGTIRYLNFTKNYKESVSLVLFASAGGGTFTKEKLAEYVGKKVRVNGELTEFNEALQIKIASLDQIKVQPTEPAPEQK